MKKIMIIMAAVLLGLQASAQTEQEFKDRYNRQVTAVGASGVGVETILDKWQKAFPESREAMEARFSFYLSKSMSENVTVKEQSRFLGAEPMFSLNDSLGRKVNYFREFMYDDEVFGKAIKVLDEAVEKYPCDLAFRFDRISAYLAYEKESPDMASREILALIEYDNSRHPAWDSRGETVPDDYFTSGIQEYCYSLFSIGSPVSYEAFRTISETMNRLQPKNTVFLSNLGTYWLVAAKNNSKALSYYKKVLKIAPKDYPAIKNCVLMARNDKNVKLEKKYLPLLIEVTPSEAEKIAAEARLKKL